MKLRTQNAETAKETYAKEAEADLAYINALREAGVPDDDLVGALQLLKAKEAGRVMEPFAQVYGGDSNIAAAVDPNKATRRVPQPRPVTAAPNLENN